MSDKHTVAEDTPKQLRALTMEEITSACGNHERNMHVIWAVQAKFCEVNGLPQVIARESAQRLAAQPGEPVRAALAELVAVKDIKERAAALHFAGPSGKLGAAWEAEWKRLQREYIERQPKAWAAARTALDASPPPQQGEKEASGVAPAASEAEIRADERERCARACEVESEGHRMAFGQHCAAVIRGLTYGVAPCGNTPYDEGPFTLSTPADSPLHGVHASAQPDYPECSGDPANCPENEGHGCCNRIPGVIVRDGS